MTQRRKRFGKITLDLPEIKTIGDLWQEIQIRRAYLDEHKLSRSYNPQVTRLATYNHGMDIVYQVIGKRNYIVKSTGGAYEVGSKAQAKQLIATLAELDKLDRLSQIQDWQTVKA